MVMRNASFTFSGDEWIALVKSAAVIGLAFTIAQAGLDVLSPIFLLVLVASLVTAGVGFVLHEVAHKWFAVRYGCSAVYRADNGMLVFTVLLSLAGVIFAAPGAVHIAGRISRKEHGIISLAGPATNVVLAVLFLVLSFALSGVAGAVAMVGFGLNAWIAVFNLIPFWRFDGRSVWAWSPVVWVVSAVVAVGLLALSYAF